MNMEERIYKIFKENFDISQDVNPDMDLIDEFGFDSLSFVELAGILTKETGIKINQSQAIEWTNVKSIVETLSANENLK